MLLPLIYFRYANIPPSATYAAAAACHTLRLFFRRYVYDAVDMLPPLLLILLIDDAAFDSRRLSCFAIFFTPFAAFLPPRHQHIHRFHTTTPAAAGFSRR